MLRTCIDFVEFCEFLLPCFVNFLARAKISAHMQTLPHIISARHDYRSGSGFAANLVSFVPALYTIGMSFLRDLETISGQKALLKPTRAIFGQFCTLWCNSFCNNKFSPFLSLLFSFFFLSFLSPSSSPALRAESKTQPSYGRVQPPVNFRSR